MDKYRVYAPNENLLDLIINSLVPNQNKFVIGELRLTECRMTMPGTPIPRVPVCVSADDFKGTRTAMFGKTRLGKSNIVKIIAESIINTTSETGTVGQLIFDINGEYANDNPQDGSVSIRSAYPDVCEVYALTPKSSTPSKPLRLNFYENPDRSHRIVGSLLKASGRNSIYIEAFTNTDIPSFRDIMEMSSDPSRGGDLKRAKRQIMMYWAILKEAGFGVDTTKCPKTAHNPWLGWF